MAADEFLVVTLPNPFGDPFEVKDPRREYDRCEAINEGRGRSPELHRAGCRHCARLVDACRESALLYELLCVLDPDATAPGAEALAEAMGFEVVDEAR